MLIRTNMLFYLPVRVIKLCSNFIGVAGNFLINVCFYSQFCKIIGNWGIYACCEYEENKQKKSSAEFVSVIDAAITKTCPEIF